MIDHRDIDALAGRRFWDQLRASVARAVVGNEGPLRMLAVAVLAEGHALLDDVPGVGKTLLARAFARSLGLTFARVQGTPDLLPADVTGSSVYDAGTASFRFIPGPVFTNLLLVDEINRATPRTQAALLEAMQERQVSAEGESRPLPEPFLVVATENPVELEGTFSLPEAELDRFLVRVSLGYPDRDAELAIAGRYTDRAEPLDDVAAVIDAADDPAAPQRRAPRHRQRRRPRLPRRPRARDPRTRRSAARARALAPASRCTARPRRGRSSTGARSPSRRT